MQEYFKILGLNEDATDEEIEIAYKALKKKYSEDRFLEGYAGNLAAKNLTKLEAAYKEIISVREQNRNKGESSLNQAEQLIREGNISDAQKILDDFSDRNAEWHYLQSVIFYKKNWISESKKQLEIAINLDPQNIKFRDSYEKLLQKINSNNQQFHSQNPNGYTNDPYAQRQMGGSSCSTFADCCTTWCCMQLLCNSCMR